MTIATSLELLQSGSSNRTGGRTLEIPFEPAICTPFDAKICHVTMPLGIRPSATETCQKWDQYHTGAFKWNQITVIRVTHWSCLQWAWSGIVQGKENRTTLSECTVFSPRICWLNSPTISRVVLTFLYVDVFNHRWRSSRFVVFTNQYPKLLCLLLDV